MICPNCNRSDWRTTNTRHGKKDNSVTRRRICRSCGARHTTRERIDFDEYEKAVVGLRGKLKRLREILED
jgi:transcriptional regulator NrdR family protein